MLQQNIEKCVLVNLLKESQIDMKKTNRCKNAQADYLSTLERSEVQGELCWTDSIHDIYIETTSMIASHTMKNDSESIVDHIKTCSLKLQPMPLPKFDGEIREYPRFKDDFKNHVIPSISEIQQPYVLKSCLSGNPLEILKNVEYNIKEMWKRLDDKYAEHQS